MNQTNETAQKLANLHRLTLIILFCFLAVALALILWSVPRAATLLTREDNPRLVEAELRIIRGQIVDTNGTILAQTIGLAEQPRRHYPITTIGPAVGYYSFRHGTAGVEEGFDAILRGDQEDAATALTRQLLHSPQVGQSIQLTLDARWQQTADSLLPAHPSALIFLDLSQAANTAAIIALVSHPGYDPNQLEERFETLSAETEAPLLNRVTQGQYQPGRILQPFILAAAIDQGMIQLTDEVNNISDTVAINEQNLTCLTPPQAEAQSWADVLQHRCPAPMAALANQLGRANLEQIFTDFGLYDSPTLPLNTETAAADPLANLSLAGIGQDNLLITPLQVSLAWAGLTTNGRIPIPQLVTAVKDEAQNWVPQPPPTTDINTAVSAVSANALQDSLPQSANILEYSALVLSGPDGSTNAWYLGAAPADGPRYILIIVIEDRTELDYIEQVGRTLLLDILK